MPKPQAKKSDLRQDAMDAVNGLHAHGIGYSALTQETIFDGFDKDLLRQLFKEAGIPLDEALPKAREPPPQTIPEPSSSAVSPALANLFSQGGMDLDPQTLAKLAKAMGPTSQAISSPSQLTRQQNAAPNHSMIPGLAPSLQMKQSSAKTTNEVSTAVQVDKPQTPGPIQQIKAVAEPTTTGSTGQNTARETYLAKLAAAKNKKKGAGTPGDAMKPVDLQPSQAQAAAVPVPTAAERVSTPVKQPIKQTQSVSSLPNAPGSTPSRPMVKMDVLARKLNAERKAKLALESAKATAQLAQLPPSRSDSISSIEYNQSRDSAASESAQSGVGVVDAQDDWTQSESATPNLGAQTVSMSNGRPTIPGLFLSSDNATPQQLQPANSWQPQVQASMHNLPPRPGPPNLHQGQTAHALPPRPPPVASAPSPKPPVQAPRAQVWLPDNSRKRPASAVSGPPSFAPAKRQHEYGWNNRYTRPTVEVDESVVIDISSDDDDDDGDEMEIDDEFQDSPSASSTHNLPAQKVLTNRAFPPGFSGPSSAVASPAPVSAPDPLGTAQNGNQQRLVELAEMKKRLQEQLKQKQELKKSKTGISGQQTPSSHEQADSTSTPSNSDAAQRTDIPQPQNRINAAAISSGSTPKNKFVSAAKLPSTPALSSPQLSGRRSGLEAEISSDELLLQQMQKQMAQMQEKINRNKTELAQELEEHGVDTQGMSVETMQAVKEDIAQATLEGAAVELEQEADKTDVLAPMETQIRDLETKREESHSEDEEGEIDETLEGPDDLLPQPSRGGPTGLNDAASVVPLTQSRPGPTAPSDLADVEPANSAEQKDHEVKQPSVVVDDVMSGGSDSSSGDDEDKDEDEDDNEEYEPETLLVPAPATLDDDSDNSKMSTSTDSSDDSDSDEDEDGVQLPVHDQAMVEESSGDLDSSDEDDAYEPTFETPSLSAVNVVATDQSAAIVNKATEKDAIAEVMDNASNSSEDGEISENDSEPDSALQLQLEAAMNEDDYEPEVVPVSDPVVRSLPTADVMEDIHNAESTTIQAEDPTVTGSRLPEGASDVPSIAFVNETGFVLPGLGNTVAYMQQSTIPIELKSTSTQDQNLADDEEDDYEPSVLPAAPQVDEVLSDDDADLYEPSPVKSTLNGPEEMPSTTGATEAGLSSDEDVLMTLDDGTLSSDDPRVFF